MRASYLLALDPVPSGIFCAPLVEQVGVIGHLKVGEIFEDGALLLVHDHVGHHAFVWRFPVCLTNGAL